MAISKTFLNAIRRDIKQHFGIKAGQLVREIIPPVSRNPELTPATKFILAVEQSFGVLSVGIKRAELLVRIPSAREGQEGVQEVHVYMNYTCYNNITHSFPFGTFIYNHKRSDKTLREVIYRNT